MRFRISVTPDMIKAEAARRIEIIMPDYQQRNALALGQETIQEFGPNPADWPPDRQALNAGIQAKWAHIKAIRTRSNEIEQMHPVPHNFRDDEFWAIQIT